MAVMAMAMSAVMFNFLELANVTLSDRRSRRAGSAAAANRRGNSISASDATRCNAMDSIDHVLRSLGFERDAAPVQ